MALVPSLDTANKGDLAGLLAQAFFYMSKNTDHVMPAKVENYDPATNRAKVAIPFSRITSDGARIPLGSLISVPVFRFGGGGFFISAPVKAGSTGWVISCDRDISNYLDNGGSHSVPNTLRMKSFSDSFFIPDNLFTSAPTNSDAICIQSEDGATTLEVAEGQIKIKATSVPIEGNLAIIGNINLTGNITQTGDLHVIGNITATGAITPHVPP